MSFIRLGHYDESLLGSSMGNVALITVHMSIKEVAFSEGRLLSNQSE